MNAITRQEILRLVNAVEIRVRTPLRELMTVLRDRIQRTDDAVDRQRERVDTLRDRTDDHAARIAALEALRR